MHGSRASYPILAAVSLALAAPAAAASYTYTTLSAPGQVYTFGAGLDDRDEIVGLVHDSSNKYQGFIYAAGNYSLVPTVFGFYAVSGSGLALGEPPSGGYLYLTYKVTTGATKSYPIHIRNQYQPDGINAAGDAIVSTTSNFRTFRAVLLLHSKTSAIHLPPVQTSNGSAINDSGVAVGYYTDKAKQVHGFSAVAGAATSFDVPNSAATVAEAIAPDGTIGGVYSDTTTGQSRGYIKSGTTYATIDPPGATYSNVYSVNGPRAVGSWFDSNTVEHGFVYQAGTYAQIDVPGATSTHIQAVNARGSLLGTYKIGTTTYSFLAQCPTGQTCTQ